jgi:hypothetical protein
MASVIIVALAALYVTYVIKHSELLAEPRAWLESDGLEELAQKIKPTILSKVATTAARKIKTLTQCNLCLAFWVCLTFEIALNVDPNLASMASSGFWPSALRVLASSGLAAVLVTWSFARKPNYRVEDVNAPF